VGFCGDEWDQAGERGPPASARTPPQRALARCKADRPPRLARTRSTDVLRKLKGGQAGAFRALRRGRVWDVMGKLAGVVAQWFRSHKCFTDHDRPATTFSGAVSPDGDYSELTTLKDRFVLSLNDTPEVRSTFLRFGIMPVEVMHTARRRGRPQREREEWSSKKADEGRLKCLQSRFKGG